MEAMNYVKPESSSLRSCCIFSVLLCGRRRRLKNKYIPLILGGISMVLCAVWVMATSEIETAKEGAMAVLRRSRRGFWWRG